MTITLSKSELIGEINGATDYFGSSDWDIYYNEDGEISLRHNTMNNNDWVELLDLYSLQYDDGDLDGIGEWIVNDSFDDVFPETIVNAVYDDEIVFTA